MQRKRRTGTLSSGVDPGESSCKVEFLPDLLGSDHTVILTEIRGCYPEIALARPTWNFTDANWPLFNEICDSTLTSFSVNVCYSSTF